MTFNAGPEKILIKETNQKIARPEKILSEIRKEITSAIARLGFTDPNKFSIRKMSGHVNFMEISLLPKQPKRKVGERFPEVDAERKEMWEKIEKMFIEKFPGSIEPLKDGKNPFKTKPSAHVFEPHSTLIVSITGLYDSKEALGNKDSRYKQE